MILSFSALLCAAGDLSAQTGTVVPDSENFRVSPRGNVLASVRKGAGLAVGEVQDRWRQATLEGWIWAPSVREDVRYGHDLVVSASGGENLRTAPNGKRIARLRQGMRLDRVERDGRWIRVRRSGWIWDASLAVEEPGKGEEQGTGAGPQPPSPDSAAAEPAGDTTRSTGVAARRPVHGFVRAGERGVAVLDGPSGDTLARVRPGGVVEVLARQGQWTRVRVEGWVFQSSLAAADTASTAPVLTVDRATLQADPEHYRGALVEWSIQFIALQTAERFRSDFVEGEPFILARGPGEDPGFVYVAVPPERLEEVKKLEPLQRLRILARVRAVSSALTAAPVLDLLEITTRH